MQRPGLGSHGTPSAEQPITPELVGRLLARQFPDLAELPIEVVDAGWDNVMLRLGDELAVRLPRRQLGAELIRHEQAWLPELAPSLPLPVPVPLRLGVPGCGYPWHWSVVPWLPGVAADRATPQPHQAVPLADFLRVLHRPAPEAAPANPLRGGPLAGRRRAVEERLGRLRSATAAITPAVEAAWAEALAAPPAAATCWLHGDLHARNVLVDEGRISAVIDWGDVTSGDPATDLAAIWMLLAERPARELAWAHYGRSQDGLLQRARGWAVFFAAVLLDAGLRDDPYHARTGERVFRRLSEDA